MADQPPQTVSDDIAKPSDIQRGMADDLHLVRTLMGGTKAMRQEGEKLLPREKAEEIEAYNNRLKRTSLFNATKKTVKDMVGKVFTKPVTLKDVSENLTKYSENVDNAGRSLNSFAADALTDVMQAGVGYIFADMPPKVTRPDGQTPTLADEQAAGLRPYLSYVTVENLIGWKSQVVAGVETLTQVRIKECVDVADGEFNEKKIDQIRVLEPGTWRVYRKEADSNGASKWTLYANGETIIADKIPLTPVYANRTGFMQGAAPLQDLAELNLTHWQSGSDQRNILHVARVPILFGAGWKVDDKLVIGAGTAAVNSDPNAKLEFVEHSGQAIAAGRDDLKDLELQMQVWGLQMTAATNKGQNTATGVVSDDIKENSPLAMIAASLENGLEIALGFMAQFENAVQDGNGAGGGGKIVVNKDFGVQAGRYDLQQLVVAYQAGAISRETLWAEMQRRSFLSEDFDPEVETERIASEQASLLNVPGNKPNANANDPANMANNGFGAQ